MTSTEKRPIKEETSTENGVVPARACVETSASRTAPSRHRDLSPTSVVDRACCQEYPGERAHRPRLPLLLSLVSFHRLASGRHEARAASEKERSFFRGGEELALVSFRRGSVESFPGECGSLALRHKRRRAAVASCPGGQARWPPVALPTSLRDGVLVRVDPGEVDGSPRPVDV